MTGSDDFDRQALAAWEVIEAAKARYGPDAPDEGYFPKGKSIVRTMYDAGLTGLLYGEAGILHAGVSSVHVASTFEHTPDKERLFKRLAYTALTFHNILTKPRAEADVDIDRVSLMHTRVRGHLRQATRPHPAGKPYSANDPAMMLYTGANIAKGLVDMYEALNGRLSDEQRDKFCQDFSRFPELFGLPREEFPQTYQAFEGYFDKLFDSGELHRTQTAGYIGQQILSELPVTAIGKPFREAVVNPILLGVLPERVREMYGLEYDRRDRAAFRKAILFARVIGAAMPDAVRSDWIALSFKSIIKAEDDRISLGQPHATVPENPYV